MWAFSVAIVLLFIYLLYIVAVLFTYDLSNLYFWLCVCYALCIVSTVSV